MKTMTSISTALVFALITTTGFAASKTPAEKPVAPEKTPLETSKTSSPDSKSLESAVPPEPSTSPTEKVGAEKPATKAK